MVPFVLTIAAIVILSVAVSGSRVDASAMTRADIRAADDAYNVYTLYVPDDYPTIQAGLDAAIDIISAAAVDATVKVYTIVRDGTYTGPGNINLELHGYPVELRSENGPENCIIDCEGNGRGFQFDYPERGRPTVHGFTITNGGFNDNGGAIYFYNSSAIISNCIITGNHAWGMGGGIYVGNGNPQILDCRIEGNTADQGGGGIYVNRGTPLITNCLITGNSTDENGGGIAAVGRYAKPKIKITTLGDNSARRSGGGLYCRDRVEAVVKNCILSGNIASSGSAIALREDSDLIISHTDVDGGMAAVFVGPGSILEVGPGNFAANPLFVSGPLGGYYLSQRAAGQSVESPCVDAGNNYPEAWGLESHTTRTDHEADSRAMDLGFHYLNLSDINGILPRNESVLSSAPTFIWAADAGSGNVYAVDFAMSPGWRILSTWENLHLRITDPSWTMPDSVWNHIPHGSYVYWRVRGADLDQLPPNVIYSDEVWWFYKP